MIFSGIPKLDLFGRKRQVIYLYTVCWNEEFMLPFFFRHYDRLVDQFIFFDDGSSDTTLEILDKHPRVEVRVLPRLKVDSYVLAAREIHNHIWKESRGISDWVIISAVDEFLYHRNLRSYLKRCDAKGITAIPALGYQMIAGFIPDPGKKLTETVKRGAPYSLMNKLSLFKPSEIDSLNYMVGRHSANPSGNVIYPETDEVLNLHYKYLDFNLVCARYKELDEKLGKVDKERKFGIQYSWTEDRIRKDWDQMNLSAVDDIFSLAYNPSTEHSPIKTRWWRQ